MKNPTRWEYKIIRDDRVPVNGFVLNSLGDEGWELITTKKVTGTYFFMYIFKRQKGMAGYYG